MGQVLMRFPGGRQRALTLSYDDGVEQDVKLIGIMKEYGLKGTFNLNSGAYATEGTVYPAGHIHRRMTKKQVGELYLSSGMEVAVHGLPHPFLQELPPVLCVQEVLKDRENLEEQFGCIVRGMAYPFGTYSDEVVRILGDCGIAYSRTVHSTHNFDIPRDWLRMPATCHHNDPELMALAKRFLEPTYSSMPQLFYLWGHSYEFEERDNWNVIEEFAKFLGGREDIWYATNIEIYDYVEAWRSLLFSADGKRVFNPTAFEIFYNNMGQEASIKPGETKLI